MVPTGGSASSQRESKIRVAICLANVSLLMGYDRRRPGRIIEQARRRILFPGATQNRALQYSICALCNLYDMRMTMAARAVCPRHCRVAGFEMVQFSTVGLEEKRRPRYPFSPIFRPRYKSQSGNLFSVSSRGVVRTLQSIYFDLSIYTTLYCTLSKADNVLGMHCTVPNDIQEIGPGCLPSFRSGRRELKLCSCARHRDIEKPTMRGPATVPASPKKRSQICFPPLFPREPHGDSLVVFARPADPFTCCKPPRAGLSAIPWFYESTTGCNAPQKEITENILHGSEIEN